MSAIEAVVADYQRRKQQHIDVPEWQVDGQPLRIYWDLLTIEQRKKLVATGRTDVDVLVAMAKDSDGKPLFSLEDKPKLKLQADASIITRIAARMLGQLALSDADIEEAEKN